MSIAILKYCAIDIHIYLPLEEHWSFGSFSSLPSSIFDWILELSELLFRIISLMFLIWKTKKNLKHSLKIYNIMHKPATMKIVSGLEHYWNMYYSSTHYFPQINSHSGRYISIVLYIIQKRTLSKSWYSLLDKTHANSKMDKKHNTTDNESIL